MILNLTQHKATPDQIAAGVVDLSDSALDQAQKLLTFGEIPDRAEVESRAACLAAIVALQVIGPVDNEDADCHDDGTAIWVMIGGAPYLMSALEKKLREIDRIPVYAFSTRESVEDHAADGSVIKRNVFRHQGFVNFGVI